MRGFPPDMIAKIVKLRTIDELPLKTIVQRFGVSANQISRICRKHADAHKETVE